MNKPTMKPNPIITVREACDAYAATLKSAASKKCCAAAIPKHLSERPLDALDASDVQAVVDEWSAVYKPNTVISYHHFFRNAFVRAGVPFPAGVAVPSRPRRTARVISCAELGAIGKAMHRTDFDCVTLALHTGLRLSEIFALSRKDVSFAANGAPSLRARRFGSDTHTDGFIPLSVTAAQVVRAMLKRTGTAFLFNPRGYEHWNSRKGMLIHWNRERWRAAVKAAGLKGLSFGALRSTFAANLSHNGVADDKVRRLCRVRSNRLPLAVKQFLVPPAPPVNHSHVARIPVARLEHLDAMMRAAGVPVPPGLNNICGLPSRAT